ncbi:MAG: hypothetical protein JNM94_03200 [Phycisphaerae bacterium]|nr:hypothetical protein [Phycisphaerae bacterium]
MAKDDPVADLEALKADMAALKTDFGSLASNVMKGGAHTVRNATKAVRDSATSAAEQVQEFVEERPFTTVLIAFGAGLLAASLFRRSA